MVRMDSDIMGIVMALLTFLVPVISAIMERNRKKRNGGVSEPLPDDDDPFADLGGELLHKQSEDLEEIPAETVEPLDTLETVEMVGTVETAVGIPESGPLAVEEQELPEVKKKGLGDRLKENPADMVLFAEIMNPKYKEL